MATHHLITIWLWKLATFVSISWFLIIITITFCYFFYYIFFSQGHKPGMCDEDDGVRRWCEKIQIRSTFFLTSYSFWWWWWWLLLLLFSYYSYLPTVMSSSLSLLRIVKLSFVMGQNFRDFFSVWHSTNYNHTRVTKFNRNFNFFKAVGAHRRWK